MYLAPLSTAVEVYIFLAQADPAPLLRKQLQRRMPLWPHRYSRKRDSRRAHFRGLGATHSAQLTKLGTKGEVRELGTDRSRKTNFLIVDIICRGWCGGKGSGRHRGPKTQKHVRDRGPEMGEGYA